MSLVRVSRRGVLGFCGAVSRTRRAEVCVCVCGKGFVGHLWGSGRAEVCVCVCVREGFCAKEVECSVMSGEWRGRVCGHLGEAVEWWRG